MLVWAFDRMEQLHADPLAGISLHQKLLGLQLASNSMVMDPDRYKAFEKFVHDRGRGAELAALEQGMWASDTQATDLAMPVASDNAFFYEDISAGGKVKSPAMTGFAESMMGDTMHLQDK